MLIAGGGGVGSRASCWQRQAKEGRRGGGFASGRGGGKLPSIARPSGKNEALTERPYPRKPHFFVILRRKTVMVGTVIT